MAAYSATYEALFDKAVSFATQPTSPLGNLSQQLPGNALVRFVRFSVYCGVGNYNANLSVGFAISDVSGKSCSISGVVVTASDNRIWAEWSGVPSVELDWNNLQTISLYGTSQLTVRPGYAATLTIEYDLPAKLDPPGKPSLSANNVSPGAQVTLTWSAPVGSVQGYEVFRFTDGTNPESVALTTANSANVSAPTVNEMAFSFAVIAMSEYGRDYDSDLSGVSEALYCYFTAPGIPQNVRVNGERDIYLDAGGYAEITWQAAQSGTNNPIRAYQLFQDDTLIGETDGLYYQIRAPYRYGDTFVYTVRARGQHSASQASESATITILTPPLPPKSAEAVSEFMFFDKNDNLLFIRGDAISLVIQEEEFSISGSFPFDAKKQITNGMRIGWMEADEFQMFEIRLPTTNAVTMTQSFEGEHIGLAELLDTVVDDISLTGYTAAQAAQTLLASVLERTDWHLGNTSGGTAAHDVHFRHMSVWAALLEIRNTWGVVIVPHLVYTYSGIERYVDVLERRGQNRGVRLLLDLNAQQAGVTYDDRGLYTALRGLGRTDSSGQNITMENAYWNVDNGDPADKPYGQKWVEDVQATAIWGRKGRRREGIVSFDTDDPYELTSLTWAALQQCKAPKITISMTAFDLSTLGYSKQGIFLGDDVTCILDPIGLEVRLRVTQNARDVIRPENSKPVIGDYQSDLVYKFATEKRS